MSVTAMYVELLVVGLGGLIWATLFISWGYSDKWMSQLSCIDLKNYAAIILPFVLSAAYVLGILIDKASKGIIEFYKLFTGSDTQKYDEIIVGSESATTVLNYMRSKIRIMRGYIFNWLLIGISGYIYLKSKGNYENLSYTLLYAGIALALITLVLYSYNEFLCNKRIEKFSLAVKNASRQKMMHQILVKQKTSKSNEKVLG
jgi:hypothetical protein